MPMTTQWVRARARALAWRGGLEKRRAGVAWPHFNVRGIKLVLTRLDSGAGSITVGNVRSPA